MLRQQETWDNGRVACFDYTQLRENAARDVRGGCKARQGEPGEAGFPWEGIIHSPYNRLKAIATLTDG